jgi:hypothetical protein
MGPELKENKEFSHWLEEWVAKINSREFNERQRSREEADPKKEERRRQAEMEPVLKH